MADTRVEIAGLQLDNPVIPASGTFGYGQEFAELYDINILGSLVMKGTTCRARRGNEYTRIAECPSGLINSVGLQNPGIDHVAEHELPELAEVYRKPVIANISGSSTEEYQKCAAAMDAQPQVGLIEVNISCPNVRKGGMAFGTCAEDAAAITAAVKDAASKPVFMKLSPNVTDIAEIAAACENAGADGITLINTVLGMRIDIERRRSVIPAGKGGLSGPAVFPIALGMVNDVFHRVDIPVMGAGGVSSARDVIEMMMAGAAAVQIGAANLTDPWICRKIIEELPELMDALGISRLEEIRGIV